MTLILLEVAAYFVPRHLGSERLRSESSIGEFFVILLAALLFSTGYFLSHGSVEGIPVLQESMRVIHGLSGEAMILVAAFLFRRTRLDPNRCTGCAFCK